MKIYLAHNFEARDWLKLEIKKLEAIGHQITSTWIIDDSHLLEKNRVESGEADLNDICNSDAILFYTDQFKERPGKGKFFELGYAFGLGKDCYILGQDDSCIFYTIPLIKRIWNYAELPL